MKTNLYLCSFFTLFSLVTFAQNPINVLSTGGITTAATYPNLKATFDSINNGYQTGVINIQIIGNVTETATANLDSSGKVGASGTSSYSSITIYPIGSWSITGAIAAGNPLINFNGADNVIINGKNNGINSLLIANTTISDSSNTSTIRFIADATNNLIINCTILGNATMSTTTNGGVIYFATAATNGNGNDNNTISKCTIRNNPSTAANFPAKLIYSNGTTTNSNIANSGILIDSCNLLNFISNGVYVNTGNRDFTISNNHFYSTVPLASSNVVFAPIWISNATANIGENFNVKNNYIGGSAPFCGGAQMSVTLTSVFQTVYLNAAITAKSYINNNTISNINIATTSATASHSFIFINGGKVDVGSQGGNTIGSKTDTSNLVMTYTSTSATNFNAFGAAGDNTTPTFDTVRFENNFFGGFTLRNTNTTGASLRVFDPTGSTGVFIIRNNTLGSSNVKKSIQSINANNNLFGLLCRTSSIAGQHQFVGNKFNNIFNSSSSVSSSISGVQITNATAWKVDSNLLQNLINDAPNAAIADAAITGIKVRPSSTTFPVSVSCNTVSNLVTTHPSVVSFIIGIDIGGNNTLNTVVVNANRVYNLVANTVDTANIIAIRANNAATSTSYLFTNNEILLGGDTDRYIYNVPNYLANWITAAHAFYGILRNGGKNKFYHNSILIDGPNVANNVSTYCFFTDTFGLFEVKNNAFRNTRHFTISSTTKANVAANFNGLISNGTTPNGACDYNLYSAFTTVISNEGVTMSLISWQQLAYNHDVNSVSGNPAFYLSGNNKLVGTPSSALTNGDRTLGVNTDIIGGPRNWYLMGAYEGLLTGPVQLLSFTAYKQTQKVITNWVTASEVNNRGFSIERSEDNNNFTEIGFVKGYGNSNAKINYQFIDEQPNLAVPALFYRLKQFDFDGKYAYSRIVTIKNDIRTEYDIVFSPNPTNKIATLQIDAAADKTIEVTIWSAIGELKSSQEILLSKGANKVDLTQIESLTTGAYFINVKSGDMNVTKKLIKL